VATSIDTLMMMCDHTQLFFRLHLGLLARTPHIEHMYAADTQPRAHPPTCGYTHAPATTPRNPLDAHLQPYTSTQTYTYTHTFFVGFIWTPVHRRIGCTCLLPKDEVAIGSLRVRHSPQRDGDTPSTKSPTYTEAEGHAS
jgi:hypothetical protein